MLDRAVDQPPHAAPLAALEARARYELECLSYPQSAWVPTATDAAGRPVRDVVIVGAGQGGLGCALALRRERVLDVAVLDRNRAGEEGPWERFARMPTLRTPKYLTGPDAGVPSLTFRAWYDAQALEPGWNDLVRIPRPLWMDYLRWLRCQADIPVANETEVVGFEPTPDDLVAVETRNAAGKRQDIVTRQLVFANGIDGGGAWTMPKALAGPIPADRRAHTADDIDFEALRGLRVAVLGVGASALDNAATALEHGAGSTILCFRRQDVPSFEVRGWIEHVGFLRAFGELDDDTRWSVMHRLLGRGAPPPAWSVERCVRDPRFRLMPGTPWLSTRWTGTDIEIETPDGKLQADFVIFATGAQISLARRPEFAAHADLIQTWRDRPVAATGTGEAMADYPYLGPGFELTERVAGSAAWLARVRLFNWAATASLGICASSITGMKFGLDRLVPSLVRALYLETAATHVAAMPWPSAEGLMPE